MRKRYAAALALLGASGFACVTPCKSAEAADSQTTGSGPARPAENKAVAITFDDLPFVFGENGKDTAKSARQANAAVLSALRRYHAPATGFVIETSVQRLGEMGPEILKHWNAGPYQLGNHSFSHADSNDLDLAGIESEVVNGEATIRPLAASAGRRLLFFRFPMNHVGDSDAKRIGISKLLKEHGYRLAASTIDNGDYLFNTAYERALSKGDKSAKRAIEDAYVAYTKQQVAYYDQLDKRVMGRTVPAVMLLHLNILNAATITRVLDIFAQSGYKFITLNDAQADPAYDHDPAFTTRYGPMWGYRWAAERHVKVDGSLEKEPPSWIAEYADSGTSVSAR